MARMHRLNNARYGCLNTLFYPLDLYTDPERHYLAEFPIVAVELDTRKVYLVLDGVGIDSLDIAYKAYRTMRDVLPDLRGVYISEDDYIADWEPSEHEIIFFKEKGRQNNESIG